MHDALRKLNPKAYESKFGSNTYTPSTQTCLPLGSIMTDESSVDGTSDVFSDIFLRQLGREEFNDYATVINGDQGTVKLIRRLKLERSELELLERAGERKFEHAIYMSSTCPRAF